MYNEGIRIQNCPSHGKKIAISRKCSFIFVIGPKNFQAFGTSEKVAKRFYKIVQQGMQMDELQDIDGPEESTNAGLGEENDGYGLDIAIDISESRKIILKAEAH